MPTLRFLRSVFTYCFVSTFGVEMEEFQILFFNCVSPMS